MEISSRKNKPRVNARVDYFVSEDKHFTDKTEANKQLHQHLQVKLSGTFLREIMGWSSEKLEKIRHRQWMVNHPY